jgi:hypothetical protein
MANTNTEHSKALRRAAATARFEKGKAEGVTLNGILMSEHALIFKKLEQDLKKTKIDVVRFLLEFYSKNK